MYIEARGAARVTSWGGNPISDKFLHFRLVTLREFCFICDRFLGGGTMSPCAAPPPCHSQQSPLLLQQPIIPDCAVVVGPH